MKDEYQTKQNTVHLYEHKVPKKKDKALTIKDKEGRIIFQTGLFGLFIVYHFIIVILALIYAVPLFGILVTIGVGLYVYDKRTSSKTP